MKNFIKNIFFTFNGFSWWHYLNDDSIKWKWKKVNQLFDGKASKRLKKEIK